MNEEAANLRKYPLYYPLVVGALLVHIVCEVFFLYWNISFMKFYNLFSIGIFLISLKYIHRYQWQSVFVALLEATVFVMLSTLTLGWDFGFQNWIFALLVVEITMPLRERKPFYVLGFLQSFLYMALYFAIKQNFQWEVLFRQEMMMIFLNMASIFGVIFFSERALGLSKAIEFFFVQKEME